MFTAVSLWYTQVVQKSKPHPGKPVVSTTWMKFAGKTSIKYYRQNSALRQIVLFRGFSTVKCFMLSHSVASLGGGQTAPGWYHPEGWHPDESLNFLRLNLQRVWKYDHLEGGERGVARSCIGELKKLITFEDDDKKISSHFWRKNRVTPSVTANAAPAQQRSQVISKSEHPRARSPGCTFFLKKVDNLFLLVALKTQRRQSRWDCFTVKIKQIKRSAVGFGKIFIFCSHYYQSDAIFRAKPGWWIFHPGHLTWRALV